MDEFNGQPQIPYYVSVQARQILADPRAASYELEIVANDNQVNELKELFDEMYDIDNFKTRVSLLNPIMSSPDDELMADHDYMIKLIYRKIYELGTDETKQHIETMNIL